MSAHAYLKRIALILDTHHNGDDGELSPGQSATMAVDAIRDVVNGTWGVTDDNIIPPPDSGNPASDTADTWIDQLHSRPQSASEFAFWLGDQLGEDLEAWDNPQGTNVVQMTRNGVTFWVTVEVENEE